MKLKFQRFVDYETDVRFKINTATNKGIATGCQQVAKNMLKKGISVSVISECTNIPEQQILNLR